MQQVELDMYAAGLEAGRISRVKCHAMHMTDHVRPGKEHFILQKASRSVMVWISYEKSYGLEQNSQDIGDQ